MSSVFDAVKKELLEVEGGYSNTEDDYGGETNWGVSKGAYPNLDIKNLTFQQACSEVYEPDFWNKYQLSTIDTQAIANKIFLALINMGPKTAVRCVQRAIINCGREVDTDGILGTRTIVAINAVSQNWLLDSIRVQLAACYLSVTVQNKTQVKFLQDWIGRALR